MQYARNAYLVRAKEECMAMPKLQLSFSDLLWAMLALMGCLAMLGFEAVSMRLVTGKW
jgi:hypothetical protein